MDWHTARLRQNTAETERFGLVVTYTSTRDGSDTPTRAMLQEGIAMQTAQGMLEYRDQATIARDAIPEPRQCDRVHFLDLGRAFIVDTYAPSDHDTRWRLTFRAALT